MSQHQEKKTGTNKLIQYYRKSIVVILFFVLWEIAPRVGLADSQFIPPLSLVLQTIWGLAIKGDLFVHTAFSLQRAMLGFLFAAVVALPLGFVLGGWFKRVEEYFDPLLKILAQVNPFSIFPIFILLFGIGEVAKIAIILWVCIWPILFNTINGVKNIDPLIVKAARAMGTKKWQLFYKIVLPGAAPTIFNGLKMGVGNSFFMLIAAEMIGASAGLGWLVLNSQVNYQIARIFAAVVAIALLGLAMGKIVSIIESKVIIWREDTNIF